MNNVTPIRSCRPKHSERLRINQESKAHADHDGEPWSQEELDQLFGYWDGTEQMVREIAELLGRTIEACRERFYKARRGHLRVTDKATTTVVVRGWLVGYCFCCGQFGDVYSDGQTALCDDCKED